MKIKWDIKNYTMMIEAQEEREIQPVILDNDIKIYACSYPDCTFTSRGLLKDIYLRGDVPSRDFRTVDLQSFDNLMVAYVSLKQFCEYKKWNFQSNINFERLKIS